jgi:hypothetical protein
MAVSKPSSQGGGNMSEIDDGNVIGVAFRDLVDDD